MNASTVRLFVSLTMALMLPAKLTHEGLHALAALPWAERVDVVILPRHGGADCRVAWAGDPHQAVVALAALAPLLAGIIAVGTAVALLLTSSVSAPTTVTELAAVAIGASFIAGVAQPSAADLRQVRGADTDD
jgi:hypothetical protein